MAGALYFRIVQNVHKFPFRQGMDKLIDPCTLKDDTTDFETLALQGSQVVISFRRLRLPANRVWIFS